MANKICQIKKYIQYKYQLRKSAQIPFKIDRLNLYKNIQLK